jgi:hypothetical protein
VWHLAHAGNRPTIGMMQSMTDFALFDSAWIITRNGFQTVWATMFFDKRQLHMWSMG